MARGTGKSGGQVAQEHADALEAFLAKNGDCPLPRYGADLNRSVIAKACGFDRKVFQTNPTCAALLASADKVDRGRYLSRLQQAEIVRDEKAKVDGDRANLESQNLQLMAENAALRRELVRLQRLNILLAETGKLPT